MSGRRRIVLAAGGTGGHIFPAQSLAQELVRRGHDPVVVTDRRGAGYAAAFPDLELHAVRAASPSGSLVAKARAAVEIGAGTLTARSLFRRLDPTVVVGFGGYPSFPAMLAAVRLGLPTLLHEQNAVLGRANRLLAPKVSGLALSFAETRSVRPQDEAKAVVTGNPVRDAFAAVRDLPFNAPGDGPLRLLVTGGSQGATVFSDVVPAALAALPEALRARLRVTQQCRAEDLERVCAAYRDAGITADLASFIDDVPGLLASAHLAITRAGASTVAELAVAGRPAVLVPYPNATDDHQAANARALVAAGGAWMLRQENFTAQACRQSLETLFTDPQTLGEMADGAARVGRPAAAAELADLVERLARANGGDDSGRDSARRAAA